MNVCVAGLWHLGTVTAACLASAGHQVTGLDAEPTVVDALLAGKSPVFEPALADLIEAGLAGGHLHFTTDVATATSRADVVWIAFDTPVDDEDKADTGFVLERAAQLFPFLADGTLVLISSQLPVGSTRHLEQIWGDLANGRTVSFACLPENLRLGSAIETFTRPERVVAGVRTSADRGRITSLLQPFTSQIEWMSVESAEMTKHALNAFLATSVGFINEVAELCEQVGADAGAVERGLKSDSRIGPRAYLSPGAAFAGGTLARDVMFLSELGQVHGVATHLIASVKTSNDAHRRWTERRLHQLLGGVSGRTVAIWGLTYKPGTDTLRRSSSVELCQWLVDQGAAVVAHDPAIRKLPENDGYRFTLAETPLSAVRGASALVVATPWPDYRQVAAGDVATRMVRGLVLDANGFLNATLGTHDGIEHVTVGRTCK